MSIALASARHGLPFNAVFYATIATIIPVFFLAIAVQGRLYEDLVRAAISALEWPKSAKKFRWALASLFASWVAACVLLFLMAGILVSGIGGEIQAILALAWERPVGDPSATVQGVILLTLVVGIGPVLLVEKHFRPLVRRDWENLMALRKSVASNRSERTGENEAKEESCSAPEEPSDEAEPSAESAPS